MPQLFRSVMLLGLVVAPLSGALAQEEEDPYAEDPYWYRPGHPVEPADAAALEVASGFAVDRVMDVPAAWGSWTALCVDPEGRLIAAAQHLPGLFRVTLPSLEDPEATAEVERLVGAASEVGWSQGLLYAFDSLYVTVAEENGMAPIGLYRLRDTDGDDQFDQVTRLFDLAGAGEHGPHNLVVGPDGKSLYLMVGNGTPAVNGVQERLPVATEGVDHLMPPGFDSSTFTTGGWVLRFDPDGSNRVIVCSGLRNSYDLAFNEFGDLFTFDSDMEWDLGAPWYRPTRICHLVSGGEFGWRDDAAKWPEYYEDSVAPVLNVGPGSPTGVVFGYGASFPEKYQNALFACDWTFGTIHAIFLEPQGGSYRAKIEEFLGGNGLPITDAVIGKDGAMYVIVGGRRLGSALYRVRYVGDENGVDSRVTGRPQLPEAHRIRRELEALHGRTEPADLDFVWSHLGHEDRAVRFAARVALETLPVAVWRSRVAEEAGALPKLMGLLALARQGESEDSRFVLEWLGGARFESWSSRERLIALRATELALARVPMPEGADWQRLVDTLAAVLGDSGPPVERELSRLLSYLQAESAIEPLLGRMQEDAGARKDLGGSYFTRNPKYGQAIRDMLESAPLLERMHHAQMLLWMEDGWTPEQRRLYFELIADAVLYSKGGYWYEEFWRRIRESALAQAPEDQREEYTSLTAAAFDKESYEALPTPMGPGRDWTVEEAMSVVEDKLENRDFEAGQRAYAAATCITCHRMGSSGGAIGPDLTSVGRRFSARDILQATIHPGEAISDQYRMVVLTTKNGEAHSGRIVAKDERVTKVATNLMRPTQTIAVPNDTIVREEAVPVSTMPAGLLNALNEDELLDLMAYLMSGGDPESPLFGGGEPR